MRLLSGSYRGFKEALAAQIVPETSISNFDERSSSGLSPSHGMYPIPIAPPNL